MSTTGLDVFDKTLQTTNIWLDEVMAEFGPSRSIAWHILTTVLHALRDRLPTELVAHFGAQLPLLVRGGYYDQWRPGPADHPRTFEAFVADIEKGMSSTRPINTVNAAHTVFRILSRHVTAGQITKVQDALPDAIRQQWVGAAKTAAQV